VEKGGGAEKKLRVPLEGRGRPRKRGSGWGDLDDFAESA